MSFHVPEKYRAPGPAWQYKTNNGAFMLPPVHRVSKLRIKALAAEGGGWEHVFISCSTRRPTWEEVRFVKNLFWDLEDAVIQFHLPESELAKKTPLALASNPFGAHLWRPQKEEGGVLVRPPDWMFDFLHQGVSTK